MVSDSLHVATQVQTLSHHALLLIPGNPWAHLMHMGPSTHPASKHCTGGEGPPSSKPNDWTRGSSLLQEKPSSLDWGEKSLFSLLMLGRLRSMSQVQHHMRDGEEEEELVGGDTGDPTRTPEVWGGALLTCGKSLVFQCWWCHSKIKKAFDSTFCKYDHTNRHIPLTISVTLSVLHELSWNQHSDSEKWKYKPGQAFLQIKSSLWPKEFGKRMGKSGQ